MLFLLRILRLGMPESVDAMESRRVLLLNLFFLLSVFTLIASSAESLIVGEPMELHIANFTALAALLVVPFIARKNSYVGAAYIMFLGNCVVFLFSNIQGLESGTYLFFFPIFFANGWLMDFRKPVYSILLASMTMIGVLLVVTFQESFFDFTISKEQKEFSFLFSVVASAFLMTVNTLVIVWLNYRRNQDLETEIAQKEKASHGLALAVKEKEILIAEIHHRVKNNLAVIRGLLNMQMNSTEDNKTRETLRESVSRVTAMALIHQKLYASRHADAIDLRKYVSELANEISASHQLETGFVPKVTVHVEDTKLDLNRAVPCALILNELLTNSFKHAFGNGKGKSAEIAVIIGPDSSHPASVQMIVKDNGKGFPQDFYPETTESLGMTIIRSLSEQIDGIFSIEGDPGKGTIAVITFPVKAGA